jgi:tRNA U38,U39,U40 pseudouridine synthase TruA
VEEGRLGYVGWDYHALSAHEFETTFREKLSGALREYGITTMREVEGAAVRD